MHLVFFYQTQHNNISFYRSILIYDYGKYNLECRRMKIKLFLF